MYDRYEYLEQIFLDATLHENAEQDSLPDKDLEKYDTINGYDARDYEQKPAEYQERNRKGQMDYGYQRRAIVFTKTLD